MYRTEWKGPPHQLASEICAAKNRTLQVWEVDDITHFVMGPPEVITWTHDGKPFQFSHPCYIIDIDGDPIDWPLVETVDRPLETKNYTRLA